MTKFELPEKPKKTNTSEDFNNLRKAVDELDKFDYTWKTYANKADRRINAANKYIEELERENQSLKADYNNQAESILLMLEEISTLKSQLQQQALPVVPECVAEFIESYKDRRTIYGVFDKISKNRKTYPKLYEWVFEDENSQATFALAFITGKYEVEKPQLFYIELPNVYGLKNKVLVSKVENGTIAEFSNRKNYALKFTEQEIKSIDERYWQFAVPVEDGE
ncbi:DUF1642 domain-containing protein [Lactococcus lactis]|uniref:DUF1642 domain-containing protein n=1 Tax=Lactococcus lactis TaxID=1358 RepID=UPI0004944952|nr:DUF1642 domain-containing protein [Lactococcus lactis]